MPNDSVEPLILPTREGYDRWAQIYDFEDNALMALEAPLVSELTSDVRGLAVADIGCGTGRHALRLARAGARVTALDFSEAMLARARAAALSDATPVNRPEIRFISHDLREPLPLAHASFDRVICCLVLDHIADLAGLFREMRRICCSDGFLVVSVLHPALMLRGLQARFVDPATGRETRPASCSNSISDYVMAAIRAGLRIEHISEHAVDAALVARSPRAAKYLGWPMLLMMKLAPEA